MAMRRRDLGPGFFKNPELVELPFEYRILFEGLWCLADRDGRLEDRAKRIRMEVFPADDVDCEAGLHALAGKHLIVRYEAEGGSYIWIPGFAKHQHPHPKEKPSTLPAYPGATQEPIQDDFFAPRHDLGTTKVVPFPAGSSGSSVPSGSSGPSGPSAPTGACAEPASGSPPIVTLPLVDGTEFAVTALMADEWRIAFPAVDVVQQLREMRVWCHANPKQRKTRSGVLRFITTWLGKEQDRGGGRSRGGADSTESVFEHNRRVAEEVKRRSAGDDHA